MYVRGFGVNTHVQKVHTSPIRVIEMFHVLCRTEGCQGAFAPLIEECEYVYECCLYVSVAVTKAPPMHLVFLCQPIILGNSWNSAILGVLPSVSRNEQVLRWSITITTRKLKRFLSKSKGCRVVKSTTGQQCKLTRNKHGMVTRLTC